MDKIEALRLVYASAIEILAILLAWVIYPPLAKTAAKIAKNLTR